MLKKVLAPVHPISTSLAIRIIVGSLKDLTGRRLERELMAAILLLYLD